MFLNHICARLKSIFLGFLAIFKLALCCFSRKRRDSYSECEILSSVSVVNNENYSTKKRSETDRDWNSWDDSPRTVDEHIELYRQKLAQPTPLPENKEPNIDFFQDMTPKIVKQTKVLLKTENSIPTNFTRLQATANVPVVGPDLEDWTDDEQPAGWEELDDENTKNLIRDKRREIRAQRQQKLKQSINIKHQMSTQFAERIGSKQS